MICVLRNSGKQRLMNSRGNGVCWNNFSKKLLQAYARGQGHLWRRTSGLRQQCALVLLSREEAGPGFRNPRATTVKLSHECPPPLSRSPFGAMGLETSSAQQKSYWGGALIIPSVGHPPLSTEDSKVTSPGACREGNGQHPRLSHILFRNSPC